MGVHVVFGAGQVGMGLARHLASQGLTVRVVRRSVQAAGGGIEWVSADARDPAQVLAAAEGADVIYHCMNPQQYSAAVWEREFPAMGEALIAAAVAHGARLVCLDNLYPYGAGEGVRTEDSPRAATGRKAKVRVAWEARLRAAGQADAAAKPALRWVMGRAGDFFGPGTAAQSLFSSQTVARIRSGKAAWLVGSTALPHAFSYVPDVVAGLAALGLAATDVEGQVFHLPIVERSPQELVARLAEAAGTRAAVHSLPGWSVRALGLVVPLLRELKETLYQWEEPFRASDARFRARFPGVGATFDAMLAATLAASGPSTPLLAGGSEASAPGGAR